MERIRTAIEKLSDDEWTLEARCPFCGKKTVMVDGLISEQCKHFTRQEHGCGGTVFIYEPVEEKVRV